LSGERGIVLPSHPVYTRSVYAEITRFYGHALRSIRPGFFLLLLLSALFLFICNLTVHTFPQWTAATLVKKYGVMVGLIAAFIFLGWRSTRAGFFTPVAFEKLAFYLTLIAAALAVLILGRPHLFSLGETFAQLSSNYWSNDFTSYYSVLMKRVALPALAHLLGFRETTYLYFWFAIYLVALGLAVRLLIAQGLHLLECLSLLTSSIFAFSLVAPGYNEILQKPTTFLEKWVILLLAMATHEVAACVIFSSVILGSREEDQREWFLVFPTVIALVLFADLATAILQHGAALSETITIKGKTPLQWIRLNPRALPIGIFIAYKLYWLTLVPAWLQPRLRVLVLGVLLSLPLILLGTDVSRLIQFTSLTLFLLVPQVVGGWSRRTRLILAAANLLIPSFFILCNVSPVWGGGLYSWNLRWIDALGIHCGTVWWKA
jgi:hypothetical protein